MSWSVNAIGRPACLKTYLDKYGAGLTGQSKAEFETAKPGIVAMIDQNHDQAKTPGPALHVEANGYGVVATPAEPPEFAQLRVNCSVKALAAILV